MEDKIIAFIREDIHADPHLSIDPTDDLLSANLLSSMDMVRLIDFLEQTFSIRIAPQDLVIENFITVNAMVNYVASVQA